MKKTLYATLLFSTSLMIAMEENKQSQRDEKELLADYFSLPADYQQKALQQDQENSETIEKQEFKLNYTFYIRMLEQQAEELEVIWYSSTGWFFAPPPVLNNAADNVNPEDAAAAAPHSLIREEVQGITSTGTTEAQIATRAVVMGISSCSLAGNCDLSKK